MRSLIPSNENLRPRSEPLDLLLRAYRLWLDRELVLVCWELADWDYEKFLAISAQRLGPDIAGPRDSARGFHAPGAPFPSTRAPLILAGVGCDWRYGDGQ